ncbi:MAG: hypothetical protein KFF77_07535 [Bacteroidetes bacterium]|nr:hypothetical protein [Bacteroidota bacterium]
MRFIASLVIGVLLTVGLAHAQDAAYRFEPGKAYKYIIEQTNLQMQEMPGQTITVNSELTMSVTYTLVETLENGNLKLQATINNALMINESPQGTQSIGADMAGKSVIFEMTGNGQMVEVDSSIREIDSEGVGLLIGATSVFPRLDARKIAGGGSWTTEEADTTGEGEGSIIEETTREYTLKGKKSVEGYDCVEIALESEAEREGKMIRGDQELMVKGTRNGKATMMYAAAEGLLVMFDAEMSMDQIIVVPASNMRIPITGTQVVKVEYVGE